MPVQLRLTYGACASEGYGSWVCVSVCECVCLSGQNKLLRLLTPAGCGSYGLYMTNARRKMHGSKVMTINTFHGDPRPSLRGGKHQQIVLT